MPDREKVMYSLSRCSCNVPDACRDCNYDCYPERRCVQRLTADALALLKEQEPRLVTADDFKNADTWGWIPAWCEEKDGSSYWEMITVGALEETKYQYWTARPTEEQRKAAKWDDSD